MYRVISGGRLQTASSLRVNTAESILHDLSCCLGIFFPPSRHASLSASAPFPNCPQMGQLYRLAAPLDPLGGATLRSFRPWGQS